MYVYLCILISRFLDSPKVHVNVNIMIDIVLLGATGYTGRLCASYMAQVLPGNVSWAIAGRSKSKLQALHRELQLEEPKCLLYALVLYPAY